MSSQRTKILHEIASNYRKSEVSIRKSQTSNQQIDHEHLTIAHHRNSSVHQDLDAEVGVFGLPITARSASRCDRDDPLLVNVTQRRSSLL